MSGLQGTYAVLGYGVTGQSAVNYLRKHGVTPVVYDTRDVLPSAVPDDVECHLGVTSLADMRADTLIVSPGLDFRSCLFNSVPSNVQVLSDIDLFFTQATQPVIGVTGTNGKSTVTSLVGHVLNAAGHDYRVGGNLGEAALDLLDDEAQGYVLELSSFQLERSQHQHCAAATILNVTEDHLDKHGDLAAYVAAKQQIFKHAQLAVANREDPATFPQMDVPACATFGLDIPANDADWGLDADQQILRGDKVVCGVADLPLQGAHNIANVLATGALTHNLLSVSQFVEHMRSFKGLAHRFELVTEVAGVRYINDSKATNVGATIAALQGFTKGAQADANVVLLAGGDAKGASFEPLVTAMQGKVKALICIGQDGEALAQAGVVAGIASQYVATLEEAVAASVQAASNGDTVLLSPACASIDMFPNFKVRGDEFRELVLTMTGGQQ